MRIRYLVLLILVACETAMVCDVGQSTCDQLLSFDTRDKCLTFVAEMNGKNKDPNKVYACH